MKSNHPVSGDTEKCTKYVFHVTVLWELGLYFASATCILKQKNKEKENMS